MRGLDELARRAAEGTRPNAPRVDVTLGHDGVVTETPRMDPRAIERARLRAMERELAQSRQAYERWHAELRALVDGDHDRADAVAATIDEETRWQLEHSDKYARRRLLPRLVARAEGVA